jgi:ceramide glucosyltransferase
MLSTTVADVLLGLAALPFVYYVLAIYSASRFFRGARRDHRNDPQFTPPVSLLKPVRGLDPGAYENFASFCRQDYPDYELLFCLGTPADPALPIIEKLKLDFPERRIRVLFGSARVASNDKVAKLARLANEADHEYLVISDSDVRVSPDYLRSIVAPLADPKIGAVTCFYVPATEHGEETFASTLQTIGMFSDFYAGVLVARQLDGVKFAIGKTIATTRTRLSEFGGYQALENRPADDLLVGRLIAKRGHQIEFLPYTVETVSSFQSMRELIQKRLRWLVVMRHMRPWGHLGLLLTLGLPWSLLAIAIDPSIGIALSYLGAYFALRLAMTWIIAVRGLERPASWKNMFLIPVWDAVAWFIWVASFLRNSIRWRGGEYYIRDGMLVRTASQPAVN